jgi:hypothetical protein
MRLLYFVKSLNDKWRGQIAESTMQTGVPGVKFYRSMTITTTTHQFPFVVTLYWTRDCGIMQLWFRPKDGVDVHQWAGIFDGLQLDYGRGLWGDFLSVVPTAEPPSAAATKKHAYPAQHPIYLLTAYAFSVPQRPYIDGAVLDYLPHPYSEFLMHRQKRQQANKDPLGFLSANTKGWMKVYLTLQADTLMEEAALNKKRHWIFGLTQVFPWALHVLTACGTNCVELDATFDIVGPYVLETLTAIVRNEGMPIAQAIFPSETQMSYLRLYAHVTDVARRCGYPEDVLTSKPTVTDHGTALDALAQSLSLEHKLCLAHLIRNAGKGTIAGRWTQSVLFSNTPEQCRENVLRVRADIDALDPEQAARWRDPKKHFTLKRILTAVESEFRGTPHEFDLRQNWNVVPSLALKTWAKWLTLGCPTTTNSEEAMHRWLNTLNAALNNAGLCGRWEAETKAAEARFTERNSDQRVKRRTAHNWVAERAKLLPTVREDQRGHFDFYEALYSADGVPIGESGGWLWPDFEIPHVQQFEVVVLDQKKDPVPKSWEGQKIKLSLAALMKLKMNVPKEVLDEFPEALADESAAPTAEVPATVNRSHHYAAWRMVAAMHAMARPADWEKRLGWGVVISAVFQHGSLYAGGEVTAEQEAVWKHRVMADLGIATGL